jgi:hypothetical protein
MATKEERMAGTALTAPRLVGTSTVAAMLGTSKKRVRQLVAEGALVPVQFGARGWLRFRLTDIERLIEGGP